MNALGWLFMLTSTLSMTALTLWCFYRVLAAPEKPADRDEQSTSA